MNTLLLSIKTKNCTTKNFKMMTAVICLTAVFVFANNGVFAQSISNSQGISTIKRPEAATYVNYKGIANKNEAKKAWLKDHPEEAAKATLQEVSTVATVPPQQRQTIASSKEIKKQDYSMLPYFNYKGITNLEEAKMLWVKENPESYQQLQGNKSASVKIASTRVNVKTSNADRRLPANYDDSKTNSTSKQ